MGNCKHNTFYNTFIMIALPSCIVACNGFTLRRYAIKIPVYGLCMFQNIDKTESAFELKSAQKLILSSKIDSQTKLLTCNI